jgi:hypothetical protein
VTASFLASWLTPLWASDPTSAEICSRATRVAEQSGYLAIAELLRGEQLRMEFFE